MAGAVPSAIELALDPSARMSKRAGALPGPFDISGDQAFADLLDKVAADDIGAVIAARSESPQVPTAVEKLAADAVIRQTLAEAFAISRDEAPRLDKTAAVIGYGLAEGFSPEQIQYVVEKLAADRGGVGAGGGYFEDPAQPSIKDVFTGARDLGSQVAGGIGDVAGGVGRGLGAVGSGIGEIASGAYGALGGGAQALGALGLGGAAAIGLPAAHFGLQRKFRDLPDAGLAGNLRRYLVGLSASEQAAQSQTELARQTASAASTGNARLQRLEAQRRLVAASRQGPSALARANRIADLEGAGGFSRLEAERLADRELERRTLSNATRARRQLGVDRGVTNVSVGGLAMPVNYRRALRTGGPVGAGILGTALLMRGRGRRRDEEEENRRPRITIG